MKSLLYGRRRFTVQHVMRSWRGISVFWFCSRYVKNSQYLDLFQAMCLWQLSGVTILKISSLELFFIYFLHQDMPQIKRLAFPNLFFCKRGLYLFFPLLISCLKKYFLNVFLICFVDVHAHTVGPTKHLLNYYFNFFVALIMRHLTTILCKQFNCKSVLWSDPGCSIDCFGIFCWHLWSWMDKA